VPGSEYTMTIEAVIGQLTFDMTLDAQGSWLAAIRGEPGCIGDGETKQEAIQNAVLLLLHVKIMKINRGHWTPRFLKNTD
jgi:predicted RNase H-like HicB family nuclease